jgi:hypothetical protein
MSTTFPIDVTVDRLVEFHGLADILCREELGRLPSHTSDDPVAEIIELMALQGQTGEQIRAWLHDQPEAIAHRTKPPDPPKPIRPPLPPFPAGTYDHVLPWEPPRTRDFLRADAWGVPVPGLPFVPRGSTEHPERALTYFLYKYSTDWWPEIFAAHKARGYTHFVLSWPDARSDGGWSIERFVEMCRAAQAAGFYTHIKLASKDFDPRDQTPEQWDRRLTPIITSLHEARAADELGVWEWDSFNVPGAPTIRALTNIGSHAHAGGASFWLHFFAQHTSWFADGDRRGRYGFYDDLGTDIDGLDYQTKPEWSIEETQARLVDTLKQFANQGNRHKLRFFEDQATLQFTRDHPDEDDAALRGYLACCTAGPARVWGYGNGARMPDGSPL